MNILKETSDRVVIQCSFCKGKGQDPKSNMASDDDFTSHPCKVCNGKGFIVEKLPKEDFFDCALCEGSGKKIEDEVYFYGNTCETCNGKGYVRIFDDLESDYEIWDELHPKIKEVAKSRFESKQYADSVEALFKEINEVVKKIVFSKDGNEYDGSDLMNKAFSLAKPIIRLTRMESKSDRDEQIGYMQIFSGSMIGIRNPKAHGNITIDRNRAKHLLYLCSLLMFKIDERIME
jgi:uncharacterized protein (TIGR02391 family)